MEEIIIPQTRAAQSELEQCSENLQKYVTDLKELVYYFFELYKTASFNLYNENKNK